MLMISKQNVLFYVSHSEWSSTQTKQHEEIYQHIFNFIAGHKTLVFQAIGKMFVKNPRSSKLIHGILRT